MDTQASVHVLCAPDKMRGALDAVQVAEALGTGVRDAGHVALQHPLADGGEGSRDAVVAAVAGARTASVDAVDALRRPVRTTYGLLPDGTAIIEAADVIGLQALRPEERDVYAASSAGLAAPVRAAIAGGARRVVVLLGGTATLDGGLGLLAGLGADIRGPGGLALAGTGLDLTRVRALDLGAAREAVAGVDLVVATDVRSPLYGPDGAAFVFGPQKGADPEAVAKLDAGLRSLAPLLGPAATAPGAGAAGGLGAALHALGGRIVGGADFVLGLTRFADSLEGAALCITCEGKVDAGSAAGKTVSAVLAGCRRKGVPCVILGGTVEDAEPLYAAGAAAVLAIGQRPRPLEEAIATSFADLRACARAVVSLAASSGVARR